jgi:hypothetical protein
MFMNSSNLLGLDAGFWKMRFIPLDLRSYQVIRAHIDLASGEAHVEFERLLEEGAPAGLFRQTLRFVVLGVGSDSDFWTPLFADKGLRFSSYDLQSILHDLISRKNRFLFVRHPVADDVMPRQVVFTVPPDDQSPVEYTDHLV